jgi:hypothetical protein
MKGGENGNIVAWRNENISESIKKYQWRRK